MARDLKLEVIMSAVDKLTAPLRSITRSGSVTAKTLKNNRDYLKQLQAQQRDVQSFKAMQREIEGNSQALQDSRAQVTAYQGALERQRTVQQGIAAEVKVHRAAVRNLQKAMIDAKQPSAELNRQYALAKDHLQKLETTYGKSNSQLRQLKRQLKDAGEATATLNAKSNGLNERLTAASAKLKAAGIWTSRLDEHESNLQKTISGVTAVIDRQTASLKRATKQQEQLAKVRAQYERTQGLAGSMAGSGAAGLATGSGILYGATRMAAPQIAAEQQGALIAAQMGKGAAEAAKYAQVIRDIREAGLGEDMTAVGTAVAAVNSTLQQFGAVSDAQLDSATRKAINFATAMGGDVAEHVQTVGILMQNGLAKSSDDAFDLITAGYQRVSMQMRGELPEILHEYSTHFRGMGFSGKEAMNLLVSMAAQGKFALDKTGDAIKEFSIRGSDMSKASKEAYDTLGLSAETMSAAIAGGGDGARKALQQTTKALLAIQDPATRANTAIALFGTPVEDLAIDQIPAFLAALGGTADNLGNVGGAADQLGRTLNDNLAGDLATLNGAWGELNATLTDGHGSALRQMTKGITKTIGKVRAWAQANPALASGLVKLVVGFGMLAAAGGAVTLMLASVLGPFAMVRYAMAMMGLRGAGLVTTLLNLGKTALPLVWKGILLIGRALLMNPIGLAVTAIAAAAYLIYQSWEPIKAFFLGLWAETKAAFDGGIAGIAAQIVNWSPLGLFHKAFSGVMNYFGIEMPGKFSEFGSMLMNGLVSGIKNAAGAVKETITNVGEQTIGWFKEKLGIHSPSRVFAELGGYTMQGLDQGLTAGKRAPLSTISAMGKQMAAAGALGLGMSAGSAMAIDNRPPLSPAGQGGSQIVIQGDTITIQISGGGQSDTLAREINRILDERERGKAARVRSLLGDRE